MKKDDIITVKSTLGKKKKKGKNKKQGNIQSYDFSMNEKDLTVLKRAMIILPILIIGIIVVVLIIGINQYKSMFGDVQKENSYQNINKADSDSDDESKLLMLISPDNPLPSDYKMNLVTYGQYQFDKCIVSSLKKMVNAANEEGITLEISGGYVSPEVQHELYMDEVRRLMAREGYGEARAMDEAEKTVPMEDHSECQSGLCVRFGSADDDSFTRSDEYNWLYKNCIKYGFILRYPQDKESSTGFEFDPTHFRYVGKENAVRMRSMNMTLDEYLIYLDSRS